MKRKRFTEEQIIGILKEAEAGAKRPSVTAFVCSTASSHSESVQTPEP